MMLQGSRWGVPSCSPTTPAAKKQQKQKSNGTATRLSDEELRQRIFANATVLFPASSTQIHGNAYEIVYGSRPRDKQAEEPPWQYAMLVRRNPSGDFTPLIRGQAWSSTEPWSMALQALLDATALAIHKKLGMAQMPPLGVNEELPRYSPRVSSTAAQ